MRLSEDIKQLPWLVRYPDADAYKIDDKVHTCVNCGHEYRGNYCPACGQKATAGRITWGTVRSGVMDVWGLGSRSLIRSLWQLVVRPGRFISDYINGKWQVSFPPVKMLVIVAVSVYLLGRLVCPELWNELVDDGGIMTGAEGVEDIVTNWIAAHPEWCVLFFLFFFILPTWFVFRHAPRNTRHTLPQGFYIMVFLDVQYYLAMFALSFVFKIFGINQDSVLTVAMIGMLLILMCVDYKSLFGYNWWGTLWRMMALHVLFYLEGLLLFFPSAFLQELASPTKENGVLALLIGFVFLVASVALFCLVIDIINRRTWRTVGWPRALLLPLIALGVMLASLLAYELL